MASTIVTKNSSTASAVPVTGDLTQGELAVNVTDKKLYTKDSGGTVVKLVGGLGNQEANAVAITGGSINGTTVGATTASTGAFTTLSASSTTTLSGGTANGVAYLNGSKVVTTGSALTFDGTNLNLLTTNGKVRITPPTTTNYALTQASNAGGGFYTGIEDSTGSLFTGTAYAGVVWHTGNYPIAFGVNNAEQMRLTSTGLGIGTSSPYAKLQVVASSADYVNPQIMVGEASNSTGKQLHIGYNTTANTGYIQAVHNGTGYKDLLLQPNGGNLGLGVTPSAWSVLKAVQLPGGSIAGLDSSGNRQINIVGNSYFDGSNFRYIGTDPASRYAQNSGVHYWYTAASGTAGNAITFTQAMTLDASGKLLLGGSSSDLSGTAQAMIMGSGGLAVQYTGTTGTYLNIVPGAANGTVDLKFDARSGAYPAATFWTGNTERARIDSSGNLLVGDTGSVVTTGVLRVKETGSNYIARLQSTGASTPQGLSIYYSAAAPNGTGSPFLYCEDSGALRMSVRSNGGIANYSANDVNLSDRREKTNFAPAGEYLSKICSIPVQTFNYIDQNLEEDDGLTLGVVAQDVEAVAPELVMESNWGTEEEPKMRLSIYQTDLQYALMKALQELKAEFDAYKATHP